MKTVIKVILLGLLLGLMPSMVQAMPQSESEQSQAPTFIDKATAWGKKGFDWIISEKGQVCLILLYTFFKSYNGLAAMKSSTAITLKDVSPVVQNAVKDMNAEKDISAFRSIVNYDNAIASFNKMYIGDAFTKCSDMIQRFIVGHEVTHIQKNHQIKGMVARMSIVFSVPVLQTICKATLGEDSKITKTFNFIKRNPIFALILQQTLGSKLIRSYEREADMLAATKLNCAQGGIDFFTQEIKQQHTIATNRSWLSYLSPFAIVDKIDDLLGWNDHPPLEERISYLKSLLVTQQRS